MLDDVVFEEVKAGLLAGAYNLLLGSGTSLDSFQRDGKPIAGAKALRKQLTELKEVPPETSLARVSNLLTKDEVDAFLTNPYVNCIPGTTPKLVPKFLWKSIYTFNIDDCLEGAYSQERNRLQEIDSINFDQQFRIALTPETLPLVHLHGFTQNPESGYVFSTTQYGSQSRSLNPWMHILAELLASEAFIVAGTSLDESDLEFYLAHRNQTSSGLARAPSLLVESNPDAVTEDICARHDLILVKAEFGDFLQWLLEKVGKIPRLSDLLIPSKEQVFSPVPAQSDLLAFYTAFDLVRPVAAQDADDPSPFFYGRAPSWRDLEANLDVPTADDQRLGAAIRNYLAEPKGRNPIFFLSGPPGSGKSTCVRRVAYDLAKAGTIVFSLNGSRTFNLDQLITCLKSVSRPFVVLIDVAADHVTLMSAFARASDIRRPFVILAADRRYREEHVDRTIGDVDLSYFDVIAWTTSQSAQLIERYRSRGFLGAKQGIKNPTSFAQAISGDVVAIASCRILNDFKPLEQIVKSVWNQAGTVMRRSYLAVAIAQYCTTNGISYPVLQAVFENSNLRAQFNSEVALPLAFSIYDDEYVVPLNSIIAERVLTVVKSDLADVMLQTFVGMANALAPYVNRRTSIQGTPEARLAGRLFNATGVVGPLLGKANAAKFYELVKGAWEWNSRYWEQRALLVQNDDVNLAVRYARQAVAIDEHPFSWTTLASVLTNKLEKATTDRDSLFDEIYGLLQKTLRREEARDWRPTVHAYGTLCKASQFFLNLGGFLNPAKRDFIKQQLQKGELQFHKDQQLIAHIRKLEKSL